MFKNLLQKIKDYYASYRILETQGVFIPQIYTFDWEGIQVDKDYTWYAFSTQVERCSFKTFDEANERLQAYLHYLDCKREFEKQIPHQVTKDPKAWRILKSKKEIK